MSTASFATRPLPGEPRPYAFPRFERRTLSNGITLVVAPVHRLPIVTVIAVTDAGSVADPLGREGLASLVAAMLAEGTASMDGEMLALRFERLGTSFSAYADWDVGVASMTVTRSHLADALALFAETLTAPSFPARELERLKAERLAELLQLRTEPRGLADEMMAHFVYAPESRFARPMAGGAAAVEAITARDVGELYTARYRAGGTTIVMAGDVSTDDALALLEESFGVWGGSAPAPIAVVDAPSPGARTVHVVTKADAPQSEIRVAHVGIPRIHPDYFRVTVMNAVLGGLFSSRINLNLRERNAYTYGARSEFDWRRAAGPFVVSTAVASEATAAATREILAEIDRMRSEPITEEELTLATSYMSGVFPIRYETTAAIATALANLVVYGLDDSYFDTYRANIESVTTTDVLEAAQRHLHPERLRIVVIGDPAEVAGPLAALDAGPVSLYDAEGSPLGS
ncbi:MAG: insulinase family protein [Gemmatimonadaceae bacterium]|nr:insulinase family protein [Gemmatimonadaceae bacterium]NUQ94812.1 insulinase family protein [Gemmatimonadaceae bacterium]NUR18387.1 insulinase family protein [Gemmatimonadaceae bacterium]NUS96848.1 insulinase family protein [Gemmatimonadaceae bacterium]